MAHDPSQNDAWGKNPFAAPGTEVEERPSETGENALLPEPNRLPAERGIAWIREGWALMQGSIGVWIGVGAVWAIIAVVLQLVPFIGPLALVFLTPIFIAGLMLACRAKERGEEVRFNHLFAGFSNRVGVLMTLGLFYFLGSMLIVIIMAVGFVVLLGVGVGTNLAALSGGGIENLSAVSLLFFLLLLLLSCLLFIPLILVQWLSPQLVALHEEITAGEAFKLALRGILRNLLPFTVNGLVYSVLVVLALIPLLLGLLLIIPLTFCTFYAAYRDIFVRPR